MTGLYVLELPPGNPHNIDRKTYAWCGEDDKVMQFDQTVCAAALGAMSIDRSQKVRRGASQLISSVPKHITSFPEDSEMLENILSHPQNYLEARQRAVVKASGRMSTAAVLAETELTVRGAAVLEGVTYLTTEGYDARWEGG